VLPSLELRVGGFAQHDLKLVGFIDGAIFDFMKGLGKDAWRKVSVPFAECNPCSRLPCHPLWPISRSPASRWRAKSHSRIGAPAFVYTEGCRLKAGIGSSLRIFASASARPSVAFDGALRTTRNDSSVSNSAFPPPSP
jgi:hypothetical protein